MTRIALVSDDLDVQRTALQGLGTERFAALVRTYAELVSLPPAQVAEILGHGDHDLVIFGPRIDPRAALSVAELLERTSPEMAVILLADATPELWALAGPIGVRAIVPPYAEPAALREAVDRILARVERRREEVIDLRDDAPGPGRTHSRVITVVAPKGGSGKTTVSTNLAAGLAKFVPDGVAIVDLDLQFGDVADALRLDPEHTIGSIRGRADQLDSAELKMLLTRHSSGAFALCAPDDPAEGEEVGPEDVAAAIRVLSADLPFVVIDTAAGVDDASLTAMEMSTDIVLLASLDVPSIRNLRKLLVALDRLGVDGPQRHLVLNRAGSKVGIDLTDVEATLGIPVAVTVPSSRSITLSVNYGEPVIISEPKSPAARPFLDLVGRFADVPAVRTSGLARFRRSSR
jgi:pilus assembly protein CpaE